LHHIGGQRAGVGHALIIRASQKIRARNSLFL
jgi:hypothetical protein